MNSKKFTFGELTSSVIDCYKSSYSSDYYSNTFEILRGMDIDGIWIYTWHGGKDNVGAKDI